MSNDKHGMIQLVDNINNILEVVRKQNAMVLENIKANEKMIKHLIKELLTKRLELMRKK